LGLGGCFTLSYRGNERRKEGNVVTLTTTNTYDAFNRLASNTDERGNTTTHKTTF